MKTLLLMRHAKSDWDADHGVDHDRPIGERGRRSAALMGRLLTGLDLVPEVAISSTAVRARTTVELAAAAGRWHTEIRLSSGLYESGHAGVLAITAGTTEVSPLMLVGHQPTWSMLLEHLTGEWRHLKTASVAVVEMDLDGWAEVDTAGGRLTALHNPRDYFGSEWDHLPGLSP